jgi:hypothetical protein
MDASPALIKEVGLSGVLGVFMLTRENGKGSMSLYRSKGVEPQKPTKPHLQPIVRVETAKPVMSIEEVLETDRQYFLEHPEAEEFIREFCPGEFDAAELNFYPSKSGMQKVPFFE